MHIYIGGGEAAACMGNRVQQKKLKKKNAYIYIGGGEAAARMGNPVQKPICNIWVPQGQRYRK
jgi:hypothetical protein